MTNYYFSSSSEIVPYSYSHYFLESHHHHLNPLYFGYYGYFGYSYYLSITYSIYFSTSPSGTEYYVDSNYEETYCFKEHSINPIFSS